MFRSICPSIAQSGTNCKIGYVKLHIYIYTCIYFVPSEQVWFPTENQAELYSLESHIHYTMFGRRRDSYLLALYRKTIERSKVNRIVTEMKTGRKRKGIVANTEKSEIFFTACH